MIGIMFWFCAAFIAYVYVGYPLLLALLVLALGSRRLYANVSSPAVPSVTVLIAAYNEEDTIARKLENTLALAYPREKLQILVAADGSSDGTVDIVRRYAARGVELSYSPLRKGKMAAINHAVRRAHGEILIFSDANNFFDSDAIGRLVLPFGDSTVGAVSGAKTIVTGDGALGDCEGLYWRYESRIKEWETRLGSCVSVNGEILAIRRDLFKPAPERIINDDCYLATDLIRRGYRVLYVPAARSHERISVSPKEERNRRARIFAGRFQSLTLIRQMLPLNRPLIAWKQVSHQYMRTFLPIAMLGALVFNGIAVACPSTRSGTLRLAPPANWVTFVLQLGFYGTAVAATLIGEKSQGAPKLLYIPIFLINSNVAGLIGLFGVLTGRQTVTWQRSRRLAPVDIAPERRTAA
jgi:poly-beta-1,6-N-acetyl-D-glucosamine synthase